MPFQSIWSRVPSYQIQIAPIERALHVAHTFLKASRVVRTPQLRLKLRRIGYAYLNRACELTCTPLHQRYVETSNGAELAWFTYRPEATPNEPSSWRDAVIQVGYVDDLTETEARSRAIGW